MHNYQKEVINNKEYKNAIKKRYYNQKQAAKKNKLSSPEYSLQEFSDFLNNKTDFKQLYIRWNADKKRELSPVVMRKHPYRKYKLDNLKVITRAKQQKLTGQQCVDGLNNKKNKSINQLDMQGNLIFNFHSLSEAERETNIAQSNITHCAQGKLSHAGGYIWQYN